MGQETGQAVEKSVLERFRFGFGWREGIPAVVLWESVSKSVSVES